MTRDMELIRKIITAIQARKDASPSALEIADADEATVARHLEMLLDAGLIEGTKSGRYDAPYLKITVKDLSWAGHDFASALGNESVWAQMKKTFSPADLATMPFGVLKDVGIALLTQWAKSRLGLIDGS